MEGAIDLDRCKSPALRQVVRVRCWCWRASFWLDIFVCLLQLVSNLITVLYQESIYSYTAFYSRRVCQWKCVSLCLDRYSVGDNNLLVGQGRLLKILRNSLLLLSIQDGKRFQLFSWVPNCKLLFTGVHYRQRGPICQIWQMA